MFLSSFFFSFIFCHLISQLRYYGYTEIAQTLTEESNIPMDQNASTELSDLLYAATYSSKDEGLYIFLF